MHKWKKKFIQFCLDKKVLNFGKFRLKSGKYSSYFFNSGLFNTGSDLKRLGYFYAKTIIDSNLKYSTLFGVAYKGIPITISTTIALKQNFNLNIPYCFNRKELKTHGETGNYIGNNLIGNILLLDDVITSGLSVKNTIEFIYKNFKTKISGVIVALNRTDNFKSNILINIEKKYNLKIIPIIDIIDIINYLKEKKYPNDYLKHIL